MVKKDNYLKFAYLGTKKLLYIFLTNCISRYKLSVHYFNNMGEIGLILEHIKM